jgi:hypothetical protein
MFLANLLVAVSLDKVCDLWFRGLCGLSWSGRGTDASWAVVVSQCVFKEGKSLPWWVG